MVIAGRAIINRPGAASRRGEEEALAELLAARFPTTRIVPPGTLEGGDVLILPDRVVVGRSDRTNRAGIAQLVVALSDLTEPALSSSKGSPNLSGLPGLPVLEAPVAGYLHLLSAVTHLGDGTLLAVEDFVLPPCAGRVPRAARARRRRLRLQRAGHRRQSDPAGRLSQDRRHAPRPRLRRAARPHHRVRQGGRRGDVFGVGVVRW